ncbi:transferase [Calidifontimicrobium sp. SYSU G02091]|uniref:spermine/spermidine synthase domain-containing protein n=1 Tax=Calidifontimicrobium sp. SYSU G02091 TaxID=2926421 RepID=UPI001F539CB7|nr:transferase [Calidifontimicrobium sp. SYSU G02091]MCI1192221.1 transferase [Calidifontimicrobium sp. SYSU G02091]
MSRDAGAPASRRDASRHAEPWVYEAGGKRVLHFSISAIQSRVDLRHPDRLDLEYTRLMMGFLLWQPRPERIAMIGLGGGSLARFCHRHLPQAHLRVVENNPHVIALRERFEVPPDGERFSVIEAEGASFVRFVPKRFDVLLVDGYDIGGLPASLGTQRFFGHCAQALQPGGLFVMNLCAPSTRKAQVIERIRRAFGGTALCVDDSEALNSIVLASNGHTLSTRPADAPARPAGFDAAAWASLRGAMARVRAAWHREFG